MMAAQFEGAGSPLAVREVDTPAPGPEETLVAVRAVGLCGSDLHILEGHTATGPTPLTLGHEIAGVVVATDGQALAGPKLGDRVFVNPMVGCGSCAACGRGDAASCRERKILGIHLPGGLAEFVLAPTRNLTVLPSQVPFEAAALIESAGTAQRATRVCGVSPGQDVLVVGVGGIGMQVVRLSVALGARVTTIDTDPVARQRSIDAGAAASHAPGPDWERATQNPRGEPRLFDVAIDCVGTPATTDTTLQSLAHGGHCGIVGIGSEPFTATPPSHFVRRGLSIHGIYGYDDSDIARVVDRVAAGSLDLTASISARVSLSDVNAGIEQFATRQGSPTRIVVKP